jgi:ketosteroid isomerase-like protein
MTSVTPDSQTVDLRQHALDQIVTQCRRCGLNLLTVEKDMTTEENKNLVKRFIKAFEAKDLDEIRLITADDCTFWVAPTTVASGTYSREAFLQIISDVFADVAGSITLQIGDMTAEDDRVSVTMVGNITFKSGKIYNGTYHNLMWVRDGKISAMKEYPDTYHVGEIFGFPNATA